MPRTSAPRALARRRSLIGRSLRDALRTPTGAIDLASIMVGVIVVGVITGVIAATVFAVIPWAQNAAAEQGLDAVRTAESVALVQDSRFSDMAGLVSARRIQESTSVAVATDAVGSCYVAASLSATGKVFYSTNTDPTARPVNAGSTVTCVSDVAFAALVTSLGGVGTPIPESLNGLVAGAEHTLAQDSTGKYWAWGRNTYGQLGDGTNTDRSTPVAVNVGPLGTASIVSVVAGGHHTIARDSTGKYWAWGRNTEGQLGDGSFTSRNIPVAVSTGGLGGATITSVVAGYQHTGALDSNGKYWAWGWNDFGQLGDGSNINRKIPTAVNMTALGSATITSAVTGMYHTVVRDSNGKYWAWGRNTEGQLGDGTVMNQSFPVAVYVGVFGTATITNVIAGDYHTVARDSTGKYWAWGYNYHGQLGIGNNSDQRIPVAVKVGILGTATITSVVVGGYHAVARDSTGKYWAWGMNDFGQLGDGTTTNRNAPVAVSEGSLGTATITSVVAGGYHTVARDSTGKYWAWGQNSAGQLGVGSFVSKSLPTAVTPFP